MKLLTSSLIFIMYIFIMATYGNISMFIDISSIIMVVIPTCIIAIFKYRESILSNIKDNVFLTVGKSALYYGLVGFLVGLILMLKNLNDPSKIGPAMAISLISSLYSSIIFLFCYSATKEKHSVSGEITMISFIYLSCGLLSFFVMMISLSSLN